MRSGGSTACSCNMHASCLMPAAVSPRGGAGRSCAGVVRGRAARGPVRDSILFLSLRFAPVSTVLIACLLGRSFADEAVSPQPAKPAAVAPRAFHCLLPWSCCCAHTIISLPFCRGPAVAITHFTAFCRGPAVASTHFTAFCRGPAVAIIGSWCSWRWRRPERAARSPTPASSFGATGRSYRPRSLPTRMRSDRRRYTSHRHSWSRRSSSRDVREAGRSRRHRAARGRFSSL